MLALHEGVIESAAIGIPDEKTGEAVKAFRRQARSVTDPEGNHQALP